jgi:hypothetical protein
VVKTTANNTRTMGRNPLRPICAADGGLMLVMELRGMLHAKGAWFGQGKR